MGKRVGLVPLDGSATAEAVLPLAQVLAGALDLKLVLLDLVPGAWPEGDERNGASFRPARNYLTGAAQSLTAEGQEVETLVRAAGDDIAAGIVAVSDELDAALVMMASHGRTGVRRMVMGSVADAVVRTSSRPVLVVRAGSAPQDARALGRVMLPLDGSARSEAAMTLAVQVAQATGATLELVQVVPWSWALVASAPEAYLPEGLDEQLEQGARDYLRETAARLPAGVRAEAKVLRGDAAGTLIDHANAVHAGLVVMSTHGRGGVTRWALGSVADKLLRAGGLPLLLVRAATEEDAASPK